MEMLYNWYNSILEILTKIYRNDYLSFILFIFSNGWKKKIFSGPLGVKCANDYFQKKLTTLEEQY